MTRSRTMTILLLPLLSALTLAQTVERPKATGTAKTKAKAVAVPAAPAAPTVPAAAPTQTPTLSDVEKASIDVLSLIAQRDAALKDLIACQSTLGTLQAQQREAQLRARIDTLRQLIEGSHVGYRWNIEQGTLVPILAPPPSPSPAPASPPPSPPTKD